MLVIFAVAVPIAAISFAGAGSVYNEIGKGDFSMDHSMFDPGGSAGEEIRVEEVRQLLEAKAYRQKARGEVPINVEAEVKALLEKRPVVAGSDPALVLEVRDMVNARNARRLRKGQDPLDVETEVRRQLADLESLGQ